MTPVERKFYFQSTPVTLGLLPKGDGDGGPRWSFRGLHCNGKDT